MVSAPPWALAITAPVRIGSSSGAPASSSAWAAATTASSPARSRRRSSRLSTGTSSSGPTAHAAIEPTRSSSTGCVPATPRSSASQKASRPAPSAVTTPAPVTTTRRAEAGAAAIAPAQNTSRTPPAAGRASAFAPAGGALFEKGRDPFPAFAIGEAAGERRELGTVVGAVAGRVQELLELANGSRALRGDRTREPRDALVEVVDHLLDEAPGLCLLGIDALAGEHQPGRASRADQPGRPLGAAPAADQAETDLGQSELGVGARDSQVAGEGELEAAAEAV